MKVFGIAGHSGMGKTTLLERLVPELTGRGHRVSLIKHSHKPVDIDRPGKDSYRLREAGCHEVVLLGKGRWALMHELRATPEPALEELLGRLDACDLVLIEGFKSGSFPKLEVWRAALCRPTLHPDLPDIVAIATRGEVPEPARRQGVPCLPLDDTVAIADCVVAHASAWPRRSVEPAQRRSLGTFRPDAGPALNGAAHKPW